MTARPALDVARARGVAAPWRRPDPVRAGTLATPRPLRGPIGHPIETTTTASRPRRALKAAAMALGRFGERPSGPVVLLYHRVGARTATEIDLPVDLFSDQLAAIASRARSVSDVVGIVRGGAPGTSREDAQPVAVTFDDGTADFVEITLPLLVQHGIPATLYVATEFIEAQLRFPDAGLPATWKGLAEAVSTGLVTIGSHTHSHALLDRHPHPDEQLDRSIGLIEDRLGVTPRHFAYPKAIMGTAAAQEAVRERFDSAAIAGTRPNVPGLTDPYRLHRSPIQRSDGMAYFEAKLAGGMRFEDDVRRLVNRARYRRATS